jgi:hypothetical protein
MGIIGKRRVSDFSLEVSMMKRRREDPNPLAKGARIGGAGKTSLTLV